MYIIYEYIYFNTSKSNYIYNYTYFQVLYMYSLVNLAYMKVITNVFRSSFTSSNPHQMNNLLL